MTTFLWSDHVSHGDRVDQPVATTVAEGALYAVDDEGVIEQSRSGVWETYASTGASALSTLSDVDLTGQSPGNTLIRGASLWEVVAFLLGNLGDVDLSTPPTDGQALVFDDGVNLWKPGTVSGGGGGGSVDSVVEGTGINVDATDPANPVVAADVGTGAGTVAAGDDSRITGAVQKSLFDANTILAATTDDTPAALTVAASRIVGRASSGGIAALDAAAVKTLLALAVADITGAAPTASPTLTGTVTIPTVAGSADSTTKAASTAFVQAVVAALAQPLDSDLTAIAALATATYGRALLELTNQAGLMALLSAASTTAQGIVELATSAESTTGTDTVRAVTPAGLKAVTDALIIAATTSASGIVELATSPETATGTDTVRAVTPKALADLLASYALLASPTFTGNPIVPTQTAGTNNTRAASTAYADGAVAKQPEVLVIAVSDESTTITTGAAKVAFRMPFAMTLTSVRASLTVASSSGIPAIDVNESGVSIFSTTLTIDASEKTSVTAATAAVISDASLADDAEITIDIDTAGTGAKGLKITLIGTRT